MCFLRQYGISEKDYLYKSLLLACEAYYMHDRQQSLEIQKSLTGSIDSLMTGVRELLGHEIDQCYERYVNLGGVPESEAAEFDSIYEAYRELRGNHGREIKYGYVKKNLPILPVSTKLREE